MQLSNGHAEMENTEIGGTLHKHHLSLFNWRLNATALFDNNLIINKKVFTFKKNKKRMEFKPLTSEYFIFRKTSPVKRRVTITALKRTFTQMNKTYVSFDISSLSESFLANATLLRICNQMNTFNVRHHQIHILKHNEREL